jgi:hypothetical protein
MCDRGQGGLPARIEVVLHEYDALHNEIVSRMEARFQLVGFLAVAGTILSATGIAESSRWILIIVVLAVLIGIWFAFGAYIRRCAVRLREIETWVNDQLGGDALLRWESNLPRNSFRRLIRG